MKEQSDLCSCSNFLTLCTLDILLSDSAQCHDLCAVYILLACNDTWLCVSAVILNVIPWFLFIVNNKSWMINSSPWLTKVFTAVLLPYHHSLRANEFVSMENVQGSNSQHILWAPVQTEIPPTVRSLLSSHSLSSLGIQEMLFQLKLENLMPISWGSKDSLWARYAY